jgi:hypothetical protein
VLGRVHGASSLPSPIWGIMLRPCWLQTTLFHGDACEALGEDAALELVDWAARRLLWLNSRVGRASAKATGEPADVTTCRHAGVLRAMVYPLCHQPTLMLYSQLVLSNATAGPRLVAQLSLLHCGEKAVQIVRQRTCWIWRQGSSCADRRLTLSLLRRCLL